MKNIVCYFIHLSKQPSNRNHPFEPRRNWKIESRLCEESYMQLMGEEYSKEEILRIPPTFSGFDSKASETFPDCQFEAIFKNSTR
jgi:hypothetical protein